MKSDIKKMLFDVIQKEKVALENLDAVISDNIEKIVTDLLNCKGRVGISGIGKAGLIGRKISATLASTGTKSYWLDPVNALHGDLGMVASEDCLILISNSGSSAELIQTAEALGKLGIYRIAMTRDGSNPLAQMCEENLHLGVHEEAGPLKLAPTCSTTAMLVLGDAIAIALQQLRGFTPNEYALFHPAGALGRHLKKVGQCMRGRKSIAVVEKNTTIGDAAHLATQKKCGLVLVINDHKKLCGVFSDGDLRRCWEQEIRFDRPVYKEMTSPCQFVGESILVEDALEIMRAFKINALPVVDENHRIVGLLDIQDVA